MENIQDFEFVTVKEEVEEEELQLSPETLSSSESSLHSQLFSQRDEEYRMTMSKETVLSSNFTDLWAHRKIDHHSLRVSKSVSQRHDENIFVVDKPYSCDMCGMSYSLVRSLNRHKRVHEEFTPCTCQVCGISITDADTLHFHRSIHSGDKHYKCELCGKKFSLCGTLRQHIQTHTRDKSKSQHSVKSVTGNSEIQEDSSVGEESYKCDVCERTFLSTKSLKRHKHSHPEIEPYKCQICGIPVSDTETLLLHKNIHAGVKPYRCEICNNNYSNLASLQIHIRTHTGEKPYKCEICDKSFTQAGGLTVHKRRHIFDCNRCNKSFSSVGTEREHRKIHREKSYKCKYCDKRYSYHESLYKHERLHTG